MNGLRRCARALALLLMLGAWTGPAAARTAPLLAPEIIALSARLRSQGMRCVPFEQRKHLASLERELNFRGELSVSDDRRVLWRLHAPIQAEYQFLAAGAWRRGNDGTWARLAVPDVASRAIHGMLSALLDLEPRALTQQFDVQLVSAAPLVFDATPRNNRLQQLLPKVRVSASNRIDTLRIDESGGNWSEYRFAAPDASASCVLAAPPPASR